MTPPLMGLSRPPVRLARGQAIFLLPFLLLGLVGCHRGYHTSVDPRFRSIQEMIEKNLPENTSRARVELFLSSGGYDYQNPPNTPAITAVIRHVDTETLEPVTARVTFTFDAQNRLKTYDITAAPAGP